MADSCAGLAAVHRARRGPGRLVGLYSLAAGWLLAGTVITGLTSALVLVPIDSLLTTGYGRVLVIKAALVTVAAGQAARAR